MEEAKLRANCSPEEKLVDLSTIVGCGGSPSGRPRLNREKASSHDEREDKSGMMVVTQSKLCHENDETPAFVGRGTELRVKQV